MTTMIALVGEQPLPNFLPIRQYKETTHVLLVYTHTTEQQYKHLQAKLQLEVTAVYGLKTHPYDMRVIIDALNAKLDKIEARVQTSFEFNLTSGTKIMSLAAYQVAGQRNAPVMYLQSEAEPATIDHYIWQDHQLILQKSDPLTAYPSLQDVLELHLGPENDHWKLTHSSEKTRLQPGHRFERAIEQTLQTGEFEVLRGVHDDIDQIDIDIMIRYQNQIGIIEAKTAEKGEVTGLKGFAQLNTAMRYLKGTYIRPFLVIDGTADKHLASMCLSFKIPIIQLSHFEREGTTTTLSDTDSRKLLNDIKEKMRVD